MAGKLDFRVGNLIREFARVNCTSFQLTLNRCFDLACESLCLNRLIEKKERLNRTTGRNFPFAGHFKAGLENRDALIGRNIPDVLATFLALFISHWLTNLKISLS